MTAVLGISAFYHDAAAALVVDGRIVAAAQEERFSRIKNDPDFPTQAVAFCLHQAGLRMEDLDLVAFYEKPLLKFDRLLETHLAFAPFGWKAFAGSMPQWLGGKISMRRQIKASLGPGYSKRLIFVPHHLSHAASAFYPSPFDRAAVLTVDGVGEWSTTGWGIGEANRLRMREEIRFPHSLGLLYSAFTAYCGFRVNQDEYKLMGLAAHGRPRFVDQILSELVDLHSDGSFWLNMEYFGFGHRLTMTNARFEALFGRAPRRGGPPDVLDRDLAASIQVVVERALLGCIRHVQSQTQLTNLCLAGGVALNCVANGRLLREGPFERIWIQPAAGDAGGALGAACFVWHELLQNARTPLPEDAQHGSRLGPGFSSQEIAERLTAERREFRVVSDSTKLYREVAERLAGGAVVGWFQGRMEFGPRALGSRSILADPRGPGTRDYINQKIKGREAFRPFAPAILAERASDFFEIDASTRSPYMLLVAKARQSGDAGAWQYPAVVHADGTARLQTVAADDPGSLRPLLEQFDHLTGCPLLVNTSFNAADEPIVCTPEDALRCFDNTGLDLLVLENCVVERRP